jgi:hypothetical protein
VSEAKPATPARRSWDTPRAAAGRIDEVFLVQRSGYDFEQLYTVGNIDHQCPELLMFVPTNAEVEYSHILREISGFMRATGALPEPNRVLTFHGRRFYATLIDTIFIATYAEHALIACNHSPLLEMFQLHLPDHNGLYPHDPNYDIKFLRQRLLKCH